MFPPKHPEAAPEIALPWIVRLRCLAAAGQLGTALLANQLPGIDLPIGWIAIGPALVIASNVWLARRPLPTSAAVAAIFALDIGVLTGLLALAGGPTNPFSMLYLVHITLAATILTKRQTWLLGALSTIGFGLLFWSYRPIPALEVHHPNDGLNLHLIGMWVSFAIAAFLVAMFSAKISELLREREESLLTMQEELAKKDRLASLVTLAAGAAHELGTPLGTIALVARELERYATTIAQIPAVAEDSRLIRTEVDRCRAILERLSIEGAEPAGEAFQSVRVKELLDAVAAHFPGDLELEEMQHGSRELQIPRHAVEQALIALVKNALQASGNGDVVTLSATPTPDTMRFLVTDHGHGMSAETLRHIGEPFYTTKDPGSGMGFGIFLVRTLAERLGGSLHFESVPGSGTKANFELPVCSDAPAAIVE
jgi:two-component system sensor histidine kinase RegB